MSQSRIRVPAIPLRDFVLFPTTIAPLYIGRKYSVAALMSALDHSGYLFCINQQDMSVEMPEREQLFDVGTLIKIPQMIKLSDGSYKVLAEGIKRARLHAWSIDRESYQADVEVLEDDVENTAYHINLNKLLLERFKEYAQASNSITNELLLVLSKLTHPGTVCDLIASHMPLVTKDKQDILQTIDLQTRLEKTLVFLKQELEWAKVEHRLNTRIKDRISEEQERYYKNQKLKAIQQELQESNPDDDFIGLEHDQYFEKIKSLDLPKHTEEKLLGELKKFKLMPAMSQEATVVRGYLDWVVDLPWNTRAKSVLDIAKVKKNLDKEHYGLEKVKDRILQSLAVQKRKKNVSGPIICLLGPPGVGKTSLGQSVADAIGRPFVRISLGGVRDEAEIRGHRKTYIGSMPGRIIKALKRAKVKNPLILLDEVDKMGMDMRGDPASALLEVLDAEQNYAFSDHYLEVDFDLSEVMFMMTANSMDIPPALRDRMEIISISGYTFFEKQHIAKQHLIPKAFRDTGLQSNELNISQASLQTLISQYTKESGVRDLYRELLKLCRKILLAKLQKSSQYSKTVSVSQNSLPKWLGPSKFQAKSQNKESRMGVVNGLAWTQVGGETLTIEALVYPGKGQLKHTGNLGDVMKESINAAMSIMRARAKAFGLAEQMFSKNDCHVHVPEGATPKDGPSAGIAMCCALLSAYSACAISSKIAMTGEVTLAGQVLAIGGLKEKLLAALRESCEQVIIPEGNRKDMQEMPKEISKGLTIHYAKRIDDVFAIVFPNVSKKVEVNNR